MRRLAARKAPNFVLKKSTWQRRAGGQRKGPQLPRWCEIIPYGLKASSARSASTIASVYITKAGYVCIQDAASFGCSMILLPRPTLLTTLIFSTHALLLIPRFDQSIVLFLTCCQQSRKMTPMPHTLAWPGKVSYALSARNASPGNSGRGGNALTLLTSTTQLAPSRRT